MSQVLSRERRIFPIFENPFSLCRLLHYMASSLIFPSNLKMGKNSVDLPDRHRLLPLLRSKKYAFYGIAGHVGYEIPSKLLSLISEALMNMWRSITTLKFYALDTARSSFLIGSRLSVPSLQLYEGLCTDPLNECMGRACRISPILGNSPFSVQILSL